MQHRCNSEVLHVCWPPWLGAYDESSLQLTADVDSHYLDTFRLSSTPKHDLVFNVSCYDLLCLYADRSCHMCEADFEKFFFGPPFNSVARFSF